MAWVGSGVSQLEQQAADEERGGGPGGEHAEARPGAEG
jgi:hypothetical protein